MQKKVRVLVDTEWQSPFEIRFLSKGEITTLKFRSQEELKSVLDMEIMELVPDTTPEGKSIPVLSDEVSIEDFESEEEKDQNLEKSQDNEEKVERPKNPWVSAFLPDIEGNSKKDFYDY